ncbi:MAG: vanadium-dependent haloperoxidase [Acidimicrobiales bacterium]|nr:vanadium-dependent haloperoxidase [Acidimicrobiales bacterium]
MKHTHETHFTTSRRGFIGGAAATVFALSAAPAGALGLSTASVAGSRSGSGVATGWMRVLYDVVMAEGLTPPGAARFYHYTTVAMYEAAAPAVGTYRSLGGQLTGLGTLPRPHGPIDPTIAVSDAVALVAKGLLPATSTASLSRIEQHATAVKTSRAARNSRTADTSRAFGTAVANSLLAWIATDGYREAAELAYVPPTGPALWRSTPPNFGTAIDPYWSLVRPAILSSSDEVEPAPPVPFSAEVGSPFWEEAMATYRQSSVNTPDQIAIARFWTDNPRLSGLPSGHWFLVVADLADGDLTLSLDETLEGFVRLGVALHDSFLNCWTWKYRYNLIRPVSYVRDHIDPAWNTLVNTPQFPEYTSGHSVASGAAEIVLTSLFGSFAFTDNTGAPRNLAPRTFTSFGDAAREAANSRLYGGIHYPMGIENGVMQGRTIGHLVDHRLQTRKNPVR